MAGTEADGFSGAPERNLIGAHSPKKNPAENKALSGEPGKTILAQRLGRRSQQPANRAIADAKLAGNGPKRQSLGL
jgi:hypothetical protein